MKKEHKETKNKEEIQENALPAELTKKWSWGAFMFDPIFLIAVKRYVLLWWYLLFLIPLVNIVAFIGLKIYFGMKGPQLVSTSKAFANDDERKGFLSAFDRAGKVFFWVTVIFLVLWTLLASFVFSVAGLSFFLGGAALELENIDIDIDVHDNGALIEEIVPAEA